MDQLPGPATLASPRFGLSDKDCGAEPTSAACVPA
jgi:hypothetical protein